MTPKEIKDLVYNYKTESKYGFNPKEIEDILKHFPDIKMDKFNDALMGITCMSNERRETIIYHCDIYKGILCGTENKKLKSYEWD